MLEEVPVSAFDDEYIDLDNEPVELAPIIKWVDEFADSIATR